MASSATSELGTRGLTLVSSSFWTSRRNDRGFPVREKRGAFWVGVVKYKGTQMREKRLSEMIEQKVMEAKEVCEGDGGSDECKVAWDEVEEISQAKADLRQKMEKQDPLEPFCKENPDSDECRIYED